MEDICHDLHWLGSFLLPDLFDGYFTTQISTYTNCRASANPSRALSPQRSLYLSILSCLGCLGSPGCPGCSGCPVCPECPTCLVCPVCPVCPTCPTCSIFERE